MARPVPPAANMATQTPKPTYSAPNSTRMGELVAMVVAEPDTMVVATHLAQNPAAGRFFTALLAGHLNEERLDALRRKSSEVGAARARGCLAFAFVFASSRCV